MNSARQFIFQTLIAALGPESVYTHSHQPQRPSSVQKPKAELGENALEPEDQTPLLFAASHLIPHLPRSLAPETRSSRRGLEIQTPTSRSHPQNMSLLLFCFGGPAAVNYRGPCAFFRQSNHDPRVPTSASRSVLVLTPDGGSSTARRGFKSPRLRGQQKDSWLFAPLAHLSGLDAHWIYGRARSETRLDVLALVS